MPTRESSLSDRLPTLMDATLATLANAVLTGRWAWKPLSTLLDASPITATGLSQQEAHLPTVRLSVGASAHPLVEAVKPRVGASHRS